ncbi:barstar family protein [Neisseria bacilliformis]|uniref:barstar family protein n=1 Tax=Neisseria bacilliformis TaxID=267212 RepID=UPI0028F077F6|nr:barstar family protein [Neisseria bacilliformis]
MPHFTQSTLAAPNRLTITISLRHLASHAVLICRLAQALAFPQPCPNAGALDDLMRDLAWLPETHIHIRFQHLNQLHAQHPTLARHTADHLATWRDYWQQPHHGKTVCIDD